MIAVVYSMRGGTGKSRLTLELGALAAADGLRVGLVDTALRAPDLHISLGLRLPGDAPSLATVLVGQHDLARAAYDISDAIRDPAAPPLGPGRVVLVPSAADERTAAELLGSGYDIGLLADVCTRLVDLFRLDLLLLDTHPGLNNEAGLCTALADVAVQVVRPDAVRSSWLGPAAPPVGDTPGVLIANMVPAATRTDELRRQLRDACGAEPVAIVPYRAARHRLDGRTTFPGQLAPAALHTALDAVLAFPSAQWGAA